MKFLLLCILSLMIPANAQENKLPCENSSVECVEILTSQAVGSSDEIKLIDETLKLAKRKGWTQYIDVSAIDPITLSIQVVRNLLGGGERQERKLKLKSLELAKVEKASVIRLQIETLLFSLETIEKRRTAQVSLKESHLKRVSLYEVSYRFGDGATETMLLLWQTSDEINQSIGKLDDDRSETRRKLHAIIFPAQFVGTKQK